MLERQDDLHCTITTTDIRDDGVTLHCMTNMSDYGKVEFSLTWCPPQIAAVASVMDREEERCLMAPFAGSFSGRWKREGTKVVARYVDLVSNGDMSLYIASFDATQDEMVIEHHKFL